MEETLLYSSQLRKKKLKALLEIIKDKIGRIIYICKNNNKYIDIEKYIQKSDNDFLMKIKELISFIIQTEKTGSYKFIKFSINIWKPFIKTNILEDLLTIRKIIGICKEIEPELNEDTIGLGDIIHNLGLKLIRIGVLKGEQLIEFIGQDEVFYTDKKIKNLEKENNQLKMTINNINNKVNNIENQIEDIKDKLETGADYISKTVDIKEIISIAGSFVDNENYKKSDNYRTDSPVSDNSNAKKKEFTGKDICIFGITLAVARDEAFCFYYDTNIRMFEKRGVKIKYFSPLHDERLPEDIDGLLLGGGYPELYAKGLSNNKTMLASIKNAISDGLPSLAECGGFMYLHRELEDDKGNTYALTGVIDAKVSYTGKLVRFGYVELSDKESRFLSDDYIIKGHEFHYYDSTDNGTDVRAVKPITDKTWDCCYVSDNHWWGFSHLYYPSCPSFVDAFIKKMAERK